eukprot:GHVQ01037469.1.p1 GENE.GHVQ01037469.1~~GHVQ01037469.1.p1  ORF type:complete len:530 (+),score=79.26 GHVQ01037469.1:182-1771(+)
MDRVEDEVVEELGSHEGFGQSWKTCEESAFWKRVTGEMYLLFGAPLLYRLVTPLAEMSMDEIKVLADYFTDLSRYLLAVIPSSPDLPSPPHHLFEVLLFNILEAPSHCASSSVSSYCSSCSLYSTVSKTPLCTQNHTTTASECINPHNSMMYCHVLYTIRVMINTYLPEWVNSTSPPSCHSTESAESPPRRPHVIVELLLRVIFSPPVACFIFEAMAILKQERPHIITSDRKDGVMVLFNNYTEHVWSAMGRSWCVWGRRILWLAAHLISTLFPENTFLQPQPPFSLPSTHGGQRGDLMSFVSCLACNFYTHFLLLHSATTFSIPYSGTPAHHRLEGEAAPNGHSPHTIQQSFDNSTGRHGSEETDVSDPEYRQANGLSMMCSNHNLVDCFFISLRDVIRCFVPEACENYTADVGSYPLERLAGLLQFERINKDHSTKPNLHLLAIVVRKILEVTLLSSDVSSETFLEASRPSQEGDSVVDSLSSQRRSSESPPLTPGENETESSSHSEDSRTAAAVFMEESTLLRIIR